MLLLLSLSGTGDRVNIAYFCWKFVPRVGAASAKEWSPSPQPEYLQVTRSFFQYADNGLLVDSGQLERHDDSPDASEHDPAELVVEISAGGVARGTALRRHWWVSGCEWAL